jgi:hypothetical protein
MNTPVVLFAYNRAFHTQKTLQALANNIGAAETELYVFIDAARNETDVISNNEVKNLFQQVSGFKQVYVTAREENFGLAKNIISGVSHVINKHGRAIVLEDDIVTSRYFLQYMNDALDTYDDNHKVGAVSGCNYPVELNDLVNDTYFLRIPLCWGWATWSSRWKYFEKETEKLQFINKKTIRQINFNETHNYFKQATDNRNGKINTWFIFWYISHVQRGLLTLFPKISMVENIGHDGSGEHCSGENDYAVAASDQPISVQKQDVVETTYAVKAHIAYFKSLRKPFFNRVVRLIKRIIKRVV